jgi:GLPGLI family protein
MNNLVFILLLVSVQNHSQISGTIEYRYNRNFITGYSTRALLEFTNQNSHFVVLKSEDASTEIRVIEATDNSNKTFVGTESSVRPELFTDLTENILLRQLYTYGQYFTVTESIPKIKWQISNEYKTLNSIKCQKAIGYFRGRNYEVWFANEIPVPFGPWKLNGLPGLILEAKDDRDEIIYLATRISLNNIQKVEFPDINGAIPLKEFVTVVSPKLEEEFTSYANATLGDRNTIVEPMVIDRSTYNEIIFEWEKGYPKQ